jgi:hypothetical protein
MMIFKRIAVSIALVNLIFVSNVSAGNQDRVGQAGASSLLINPWARSTGMGMANTANATGVEAMNLNVAGTAFTRKTEILFSHSIHLSGSGININSFGLTQKAGDAGVIGLSVMSMNFGDIMRTTVDQPEGGLGTFSPNYLTIAASYAKEFSNSIYGGMALRIVSESINNVGAQGVAIDAGVRYVTGENDKIKFGIALRNVGPKMSYKGSGLNIRGVVRSTDANLTFNQQSEPFELPSLLNIGGSYDLDLALDHKLTIAGNFTSNSFTKDQFMLGTEYDFKKIFQLRAGYVYESGLFNNEQRQTVYTGPAAGFSVQIPLGKGGANLNLDYSYRTTNPFAGTHCLGMRINL